MWMFTLILIMGFGVWVLHVGVAPDNQIVTTLLGVLVGTAFGSVNGALFTSMNGTTPPDNTVTKTVSTTVTPPNPLAEENNASSGVQTQVNTTLNTPVNTLNDHIKLQVPSIL